MVKSLDQILPDVQDSLDWIEKGERDTYLCPMSVLQDLERYKPTELLPKSLEGRCLNKGIECSIRQRSEINDYFSVGSVPSHDQSALDIL